LYVASQNGHLEVVRLLVEAGADMDMAVNTGGGAVTPLWIARRRDHDDIVEILQRAGATR
jgi:ankyrin repeat protein